MNPLQRASLFTLTLIFSFVLSLFILLGLYTESFSLPQAIFLTLLVNFFLWLFGPAISDYLYRLIYQVHFFSSDEFAQKYPQLNQFIDQVAAQYKFKFPKIGFINDGNPTAFTYGSTRNNARVIFTRGIIDYLTPEEQKAVLAHELGHIHHGDFIIMTVAITFVQVLYEIYVSLARSKNRSSGKKGKSLAWLGFLSYLFYFLASYLLLYLSRLREYYADDFAAKASGAPENLSAALIKVAYGILQAEDTEGSKRLLNSTRHLGIIDVKNAGFVGGLASLFSEPSAMAEVMVFDQVSPWARILELSSTHPLTGKRIAALEKLSQKMGQRKLFDIEAALLRLKVERKKLYQNFYFEVLIYFLPWLLPLPGFLLGGIGGAILGLALGGLVKLNFQFPEKEEAPTTIFGEMRNPYASPLRGKRIALEGKVVGRGVPGFVFSEDMMFQDKTGIIYLDYQSFFGFLGDWFFAVKEVKRLMGEEAKVVGWFFRGLLPHLTLAKVQSGEKIFPSHPKFWNSFIYLLLFFLGIFLSSHTRRVF